MNFPGCRAPHARLWSALCTRWDIRRGAARFSRVNKISHHVAFKLYPLALNLILNGLYHRRVVAVVKIKSLFPARSEFHDHLVSFVAYFRGIGNHVNVNIPQIGPFAVTGFFLASEDNAGNEGCD